MSNICVFEDTDLRWKCPHYDVDEKCYGGLRNGKCPFNDILRKIKEAEEKEVTLIFVEL